MTLGMLYSFNCNLMLLTCDSLGDSSIFLPGKGTFRVFFLTCFFFVFLNRGIHDILHAPRLISAFIFLTFFSHLYIFFVFFHDQGVRVNLRASQFFFSLLFKNVFSPYTLFFNQTSFFFNSNFHCLKRCFMFFLLTGLFICFFYRDIRGSLCTLRLISKIHTFFNIFFPVCFPTYTFFSHD